jgi:CHAD domain-containing protein
MEPSAQYSALRKRLDAFERALPAVVDGSVEALHRTRVASRRLRELLPLLELDGDRSHKFNRRLRRVTKQLGPVRELDVLLLLIEELQQSTRYSPAALRQLSLVAGHARDVARKRLTAKLSTAKLQRLANELERATEPFESHAGSTRLLRATGKTRAWLWALDARLARRATSARSAIEVASNLYVPERLHDVRIALKKLRYVAELSLEVGRRRVTTDIVALKRAQGVLGRLHDLNVLLMLARETQASLSPPDLMAWKELGALVHGIEDDCRQLHGRYMRLRHALIAITERMGARKPDTTATGRRAMG